MTFRWRGVRVTLSFWFFLGASLLLLADRSGLSGLFLAAIAIHEGGHLLYMLLARLPLGEVELSPRGLLLSLAPGCCPTPGQSLLLNLAGCGGNFLFAVIFALWPRGGAGLTLLRLSAVNAALGLANLLPAPGLDGAQALEDLLVLLLGWERGTRLHAVLMRIICLAGAGGCLWLLVTRGVRGYWVCLLLVFGVGLASSSGGG